MAEKIRDIMTAEPVTIGAQAPVSEAARLMKHHDIGDVIVLGEGGELFGLITDRDLAVRVLAEGRDPASTRLGEVCSRDLACLRPDDDIEAAVQLIRTRAVRRIPVVEDAQVVGILSIGDLAIERDERSALAEVSAAPPNS